MDDKRQLIVTTARKIFIENGFMPSSMEDVAKLSGMGKASIYHYFESKDALFHAVIDFEVEDMSTHILDKVKSGKSASEKLQLYIEAKFQRMRERFQDMKKFKMPLMQDLGDKYFVIMSKFGQRETEMLTGILVHGITTGEFKQIDPLKISQIMVTMFWGLQFSVFQQNCIDGFSKPTLDYAENQAKLCIDTLLNGILQNQNKQESN